MERFPRRSGRTLSHATRWRGLGLALLLLPALQGGVHAQAQERQPGWLHLDTGLSYGRETLESYWVTLVRRPGSASPYQLGAARHSISVHWERGNSLQLETPGPTVWTRDMAPRRPQLALAENSEALKAWLRSSGLLAARRCQAPVMKMRSTMADGTTRADVALLARCTFY
jgi:hypothetical protein